ncbi:hypothetical protein ABZS66_06745 [Dactylosporangium sp. NPDC005572]|uniref:hypothetical protein n=1 Tax=Dactylosporangium sp. NPDC005572 TaxID=3156889 RepID=UPI0033B2297F
MTRSRIGLLIGAAVLVVVGGLPTVAKAQPTPTPTPPAPAPSETMNGHHDMWGDVLHGEGTLQTKKGPVRVAMQNGEATTLTQSSVTVRSADGYTRTWQLGDNLKVYDKRHTLQPGALRSGADLMIAGKITSGTATANGTPAPATYTAQVVFVHSPPPSS